MLLSLNARLNFPLPLWEGLGEGEAFGTYRNDCQQNFVGKLVSLQLLCHCYFVFVIVFIVSVGRLCDLSWAVGIASGDRAVYSVDEPGCVEPHFLLFAERFNCFSWNDQSCCCFKEYKTRILH